MANNNGGLLGRFLGIPLAGPPRLNPMKPAGRSGTAVFGGFVRENEANSKLVGIQRFKMASDILTNTSVVAAGVRYFLNLVAKPRWKVVPADDTPEARQIAEFFEEVLFGMDTSWNHMIRRCGFYRYHGFGIAEWTAYKRDDGRIGYKSIDQRPQHTIWRWGIDDAGAVLGVWQRNPQTGQEIWLPRSKIVYFVDDLMTDSPEGLGWFRALAEPAERFKKYTFLETVGYERNLAGIPIGKLPIAEMQAAVTDGNMDQKEMDKIIAEFQSFTSLQSKNSLTHMLLDSVPYESTTADGSTISPVPKYSLELLKGDVAGIEHLATAIDRLTHDMARIMGVESLLLGATGKGSLALSKTQSENLWLVINSTIQDMAEVMDRDAIGPLIVLNGIPDKLRPTLRAEDVAFKDVEELAGILVDMANAGAVLSPHDPAIDEIRALAGLSASVPMEADMPPPGGQPKAGNKKPAPNTDGAQMREDIAENNS
jgi:hypothetical protein